jgi:RHS repeat-associated protein
LNRSWTYKKNDKGQIYFGQDPAGNFTNYFYEDPWGNITKKEEHEKLPDGTEKVHVTKYKYNSQGKIEEIRELMNENDPNQEDDEKDLITTFYYDTRGNLTGTTDAEGNKISHEYDGFNRKTLTKRYLKNGEEIKTSFTYYDNNLPKTITDDKGNVTEYQYDDQKRLTKVIYPDESYIEITHTKITKEEKDYKRVIIKQRNGTIVTNDYDKSSRLVSRTIQPAEGVEGTTFEIFDYDGLNRLTYAENDNFVVKFKFDPLNRITEEEQRGKLLNYTYSVVNNLRQMTMKYPNDRLIEKNFDILDRLSNIKQGDNAIADFSYIGRSYRLLSKQFGNGDAVSYLYDQGRRMTEKKAINKNNDLINHYKHGYNKVHMKTYEQRLHENGISDIFGYDAVYRLTNEKFNVPDPTAATPTDFERERNIFLDHLDNITRIDETINGETTQIATEIPLGTDYFKLNQYSRFDQWGLAFDKNGNLTQKGTQKMYHDYRNQMVRVTEGTTTTENKYDALGRRLQMIVNTGSQTKTENYYYAGHQIFEVRDGSDQVKRQFIYGNGIDEVVRMDVYSGSIATHYYFHTNAIGSTTAITDANGQVVERYKYGLFGMPTFMDAAGNVISNSAIGNNILFQGREYEPETNFYYFRARHLDPIMGRFLSTDPMGYQDSLNLYQAFGMNPVNFTDPMGTLLKAELGKHDMFKTQEIKTGKWYLDYTVVGAFNELRNLSALGINLVSNLFGTTEDIVFDVGDYGLSKVGMIERGELRDDPHMRNLFNAIMLTNPEAMASGTRTVMNKLDELTLSLYNLVKSKGGKVLDIRGNTIISTGTELSGDDLARVFGRGDDIYYNLDDLPIMTTDDVKAALQSGNYTKSKKWAYSIHEHHWYPGWLGGKSSGVTAKVRGFEHITEMEPGLFEYIKTQIPLITKKSIKTVQSLIRRGVVTQKEITDTLFKFYKARYPNLSDEAIMDALKLGVE